MRLQVKVKGESKNTLPSMQNNTWFLNIHGKEKQHMVFKIHGNKKQSMYLKITHGFQNKMVY